MTDTQTEVQNTAAGAGGHGTQKRGTESPLKKLIARKNQKEKDRETGYSRQCLHPGFIQQHHRHDSRSKRRRFGLVFFRQGWIQRTEESHSVCRRHGGKRSC